MSKYVYFLDPGHGGIINGKYVTPGKRSPKFEDGTQLFEGVYNRAVVKKIASLLSQAGIRYEIIAPVDTDMPLDARVKRANDFRTQYKNCMYISIHGDANGDGVQWDQASGISVFTSIGDTGYSDDFAEIVINALQTEFGNQVKWRTENTDGDKDKEENFYVLKHTKCPAILGEHGFFTNKEECKKMLTDEWQWKVANSYLAAIKKWEELNKTQ